MKKILFAALMAVTGITYSQAPVWQWANVQAGRTSADGSIGIAKDASSNIYTIGDFEGVQNVGANTFSPIGFNDVFVSKADLVGNISWSVQFGGQSNFAKAAAIGVDASGNSYIVGSFTYIMIVGPNTFTSFGQKDMFLAKLDQLGNVLWSKQIGGPGDEDPSTLIVDGATIYLAGSYAQTFTDGTVTYPATISNSQDIFFAKYDTSGTCINAVKFGGTQPDRASSLSVNGSSIYMAGYFAGSNVAFGSTNLTSLGANDAFVAKLDPSGTVIWAKSAGKQSNDQALGVTQDGSGNCFLGGIFYGTNVVFGPGVTMSESQGYGDGFVVKYNGSTGAAVWARKVSGPFPDMITSVSADLLGSVYVTGYFNNTAVLSSTVTPTASLATLGGKDVFAAKYSGNGSLMWSVTMGSTNDDIGKVIICDNTGHVNISGNFYGTVTPGNLAPIQSSGTSFSIFNASVNGFTTGLNQIKENSAFVLFPNPASGSTEVSTGKDPLQSYELYNVMGQLMSTENFVSTTTSCTINLDGFTPGNYFLTVKTKSGVTSKMLKVD
ncbi:SBBP repeat-containing protein [soil metagenome]